MSTVLVSRALYVYDDTPAPRKSDVIFTPKDPRAGGKLGDIRSRAFAGGMTDGNIQALTED